jgi:hypothetical protein
MAIQKSSFSCMQNLSHRRLQSDYDSKPSSYLVEGALIKQYKPTIRYGQPHIFNSPPSQSLSTPLNMDELQLGCPFLNALSHRPHALQHNLSPTSGSAFSLLFLDRISKTRALCYSSEYARLSSTQHIYTATPPETEVIRPKPGPTRTGAASDEIAAGHKGKCLFTRSRVEYIGD